MILEIGNKAAVMLVILTDGFSKFESGSQLCSYAGITPIIRESGSSVRWRSRISTVGNKKPLNLLFLCAFNTCKHNKAFREL
jgi:transposase